MALRRSPPNEIDSETIFVIPASSIISIGVKKKKAHTHPHTHSQSTQTQRETHPIPLLLPLVSQSNSCCDLTSGEISLTFLDRTFFPAPRGSVALALQDCVSTVWTGTEDLLPLPPPTEGRNKSVATTAAAAAAAARPYSERDPHDWCYTQSAGLLNLLTLVATQIEGSTQHNTTE